MSKGLIVLLTTFLPGEILPTERMIDCDPIHLVSPCDGKISDYPLG